MIGYHFLQADFRARRGDEQPWEVGETRTIADASRISLCEYGYHFSRTLWEALVYAPGPLACQVEVPDDALYRRDKGVAAQRTLIRAVNIDAQLRLFACDCADRTVHLFEKQYPDDERPRLAIETARRFARGQADRSELVAARDAAWDAAWDAAGDARAAAGAAARAAAWDARAAAGAAAWAAGDAERAWQQQHFEEMFGGIFG